MKAIRENPNIKVQITPEVEGHEVLRGSYHPRAIVRDGEWIATHLDYSLGKFGSVGGESEILSLKYGNCLKFGDKVRPFREDGESRRYEVVVNQGLLESYGRDGLQPDTDDEDLKKRIFGLDSLLRKAESNPYYIFQHEHSLVDCGSNHVGDHVGNELGSLVHERKKMSEKDRNFVDSQVVDLDRRLERCYNSIYERGKK
ncbi:MAG: hypothetical protein ABIJ58_02915 [Nanoarchaeota archaeon]